MEHRNLPPPLQIKKLIKKVDVIYLLPSSAIILYHKKKSNFFSFLSLLSLLQKAYSEPSHTALNYFCEKLHIRCLTMFWMRLLFRDRF